MIPVTAMATVTVVSTVTVVAVGMAAVGLSTVGMGVVGFSRGHRGTSRVVMDVVGHDSSSALPSNIPPGGINEYPRGVPGYRRS